MATGPRAVDRRSDNPSFSQFFVNWREGLMARLVGGHDASARTSLFPLLDQIGKRLIHQCRKLSSLALRDGSDCRENFSTHLNFHLFARPCRHDASFRFTRSRHVIKNPTIQDRQDQAVQNEANRLKESRGQTPETLT